MKHKWLQAAIVAAIVACLPAGPSRGDVTMTAGAGTTVFDFTCFSTKHCPAAVPIDSAGAGMFGLAGLPVANSLNAVTVQPITLGNGTSANAARVTISNDSTGVVAATQSGAWNITNITGAVSLPTGAATSALQQSVTTWGGGTLGAMANYGTSPGAVLVPGVNAFVTNANANGQAVMASSAPVVLASNQSAADPCMFHAKAQKNINTASGTTLLVAASGSTQVFVCSLALIAPSAVAVSLSEGTGTTCNTANQAGVMGVAVNGTAANGMSFAANGGMTYGNGGNTVAFTATAGNALCLFQSGTAQLAGNITYVQQ